MVTCSISLPIAVEPEAPTPRGTTAKLCTISSRGWRLEGWTGSKAASPTLSLGSHQRLPCTGIGHSVRP